jgi:hypothetical protein
VIPFHANFSFAQKVSKVSDKSSTRAGIMATVAVEMRDAIIALAGERSWSETRERWLERAALKAGVSYRTAKSIFYRELRDPKISVVALVRHAVERKSAIKEESARGDFTRLDERLRALERRLAAIDPDFNGGVPCALCAAPNGARGKDRAMG